MPRQVAKASEDADAKMQEIESKELEAAKDAVKVEAIQPENSPVVPPPPEPTEKVSTPVPTVPVADQELPRKYDKVVKAGTYEALVKQFDDLEHRFSVNLGRLKAEAEKAKEALKRVAELEQLSNLQMQQIAKFQTNTPSVTPSEQHSATPSASAPAYEPTPEEKEQFGDDYLKMTAKVSQAVSEKTKLELDRKIKELEVAQTRTRFDNMINQVIAIHPDFLAIDQSDDFNDWLQLPDGFSGYTFKNSLDNAAASYDVEKIAGIVEAYKKSKGMVKVQQPAAPAPSLENQIAPSKTGTPSASPGKRMFSMAQIKKTYEAITKGQYTQAQAESLMKEIDAAIEQGLVTT